MRVIKKFLFVAIVSIIFTSACALADDEEWYTLGDYFQNLTSRAQAETRTLTVQEKNLDEGALAKLILSRIKEYRPSAVKPFKKYSLRAKTFTYDGKSYVTLLLCNRTETRAYIEDMSCTARIDKHHWQSMRKCEFDTESLEAPQCRS